LDDEPFAWGKDDKLKVRARLRINGATDREIDFLVGQQRRVELNAMTSPQFIEYVEEKLTEYSPGKVIPDEGTLGDAYRLFVRSSRAKRVAERALAEMSTEEIRPPADLKESVCAYLAEHPAASWDDAVATLVGHDNDPDNLEEAA
jgi:hypothetical protein